MEQCKQCTMGNINISSAEPSKSTTYVHSQAPPVLLLTARTARASSKSQLENLMRSLDYYISSVRRMGFSNTIISIFFVLSTVKDSQVPLSSISISVRLRILSCVPERKKQLFVLLILGNNMVFQYLLYSVQYNGGFLPDIILLTLSMRLTFENPFKYHQEFLSPQPMFPPKYFDSSSSEGRGRMLRRFRCVQFFLKFCPSRDRFEFLGKYRKHLKYIGSSSKVVSRLVSIRTSFEAASGVREATCMLGSMDI